MFTTFAIRPISQNVSLGKILFCNEAIALYVDGGTIANTRNLWSIVPLRMLGMSSQLWEILKTITTQKSAGHTKQCMS